jgi:hypothetical protein
MKTDNDRLTEPLAGTTRVIGLGFAIILAVSAVTAALSTGSFGGFAAGPTFICATDPYIGTSATQDPHTQMYTARPGSALRTDINLGACTQHPTLQQRILDTMTNLPTAALYAGILLLLWQIVRSARRDGPFTHMVAGTMRRLGWVIMLGAVAAAGIQQLASGMLLNSMLTHEAESPGYAIDAAVWALVPVPILAGVALLTFARIIRLGAAMDDELKATV